METQNSVTFSNITVSSNEITGKDSNGENVTIPKNEIRKIELFYGFCVENKIRKIVISIIIIAVGMYFCFPLLSRLWFESFASSTPERMPAPYSGGTIFLIFCWPLLGFYMLYDVFRRKYFLKIEKHLETKNLIFEKAQNGQEVLDFVRRLNEFYDYPNVEFKKET